MVLKLSFIFLLLLSLTTACSKKEEKVTLLKENNLETQMIEVYNQAMEEFDKGDVIYAGKNLMKLNCYIHNLSGRLEQF